MLRPRHERMVLASCILSVTLLCMMVPLSSAQKDIPGSQHVVMCEICNVFTSTSRGGMNTHLAKCVKKNRVLPMSGGDGGGGGGIKDHPTHPKIPAPVSKPPNESVS